VHSQERKFLFAAGGTGGHLFPALAIADAVRRRFPDAEILFVGTSGKIEERLVPDYGYRLVTLWLSGFHRRLAPGNLLFPLKVAVSLVQSFFLIRRFKPDVVIGTGAYVCGPVGFAASMFGIPLVLHESNSYPGLTTRLLSSRASVVLLGFSEAARWLRKARRLEAVGTPVRFQLATAARDEAARFFKLDPSQQTLLVFGGSLGAATINDAVLAMLRRGLGNRIQLIWQTGKSDYERVTKAIEAPPGVWIGPFIDRMEFAYAAADLVVCRAGAATIAELIAVQKPAVLVPYPHAAADHQTHNAMVLVSAGGAVLLPDDRVNEELESVVRSLFEQRGRLEAMKQALTPLQQPDTLERIVAVILDTMNYRRNGTGA
jgi:UDP-N-acetylglucosamine--N-acetylmuramyl-(pentapeptide) pyrophosphoryl-undecaprenol N-acetylglucosamine transferase